MTTEATIRKAAQLVYKAMQTTLSPVNDGQYRELLALYRSNSLFAEDVHEIAEGLELMVLDVSEQGLVVVPASRDSRFALRAADIRTNLKTEQKAALVLAHVAVAAVFYPTTDVLEDDEYIALPSTVPQFRDMLHAVARQLEQTGEQEDELPPELAPGWALVCTLPSALPNAARASLNSITGLVTLALNHMMAHGLVKIERESVDDDQVTYYPTHRFRVQLRDLTLRRLFELAQACQVGA